MVKAFLRLRGNIYCFHWRPSSNSENICSMSCEHSQPVVQTPMKKYRPSQSPLHRNWNETTPNYCKALTGEQQQRDNCILLEDSSSPELTTSKRDTAEKKKEEQACLSLLHWIVQTGRGTANSWTRRSFPGVAVKSRVHLHRIWSLKHYTLDIHERNAAAGGSKRWMKVRDLLVN